MEDVVSNSELKLMSCGSRWSFKVLKLGNNFKLVPTYLSSDNLKLINYVRLFVAWLCNLHFSCSQVGKGL